MFSASCRKAKSSCDGERPCFRCIRLKRQEQCCDPEQVHTTTNKTTSKSADEKKTKKRIDNSDRNDSKKRAKHNDTERAPLEDEDQVTDDEHDTHVHATSTFKHVPSSNSTHNDPVEAVELLQNALTSVLQAHPELLHPAVLPLALSKATLSLVHASNTNSSINTARSIADIPPQNAPAVTSAKLETSIAQPASNAMNELQPSKTNLEQVD